MLFPLALSASLLEVAFGKPLGGSRGDMPPKIWDLLDMIGPGIPAAPERSKLPPIDPPVAEMKNLELQFYHQDSITAITTDGGQKRSEVHHIYCKEPGIKDWRPKMDVFPEVYGEKRMLVQIHAGNYCAMREETPFTEIFTDLWMIVNGSQVFNAPTDCEWRTTSGNGWTEPYRHYTMHCFFTPRETKPILGDSNTDW